MAGLGPPPPLESPLHGARLQPMLELLGYLRANGFKTFIATGGSAGFVREYSDRVYGIPPEQVCGSEQAFKYGYDPDHRPILVRDPKFVLNNLEAGKIENFWLMYGWRPIAAFGNSSGDDQQMLEYVKAGSGLRLSGAVLHDDAEREYAYGPAEGLPRQPHRPAQPGHVRHGGRAELDDHQDEARLEADFRFRVTARPDRRGESVGALNAKRRAPPASGRASFPAWL